MGAPMAQNLLAARSHLVVRHRSWISGPRRGRCAWTDRRESAAATDAILVMLPDLPELEAALDGPTGCSPGIPDGGYLLLMIGSTSSRPACASPTNALPAMPGRRIGRRLPGLGSVDGATAGTSRSRRRRMPRRAPPLRCAPAERPSTQAVGAGEVAKACNQLVIAATIALREASELAARSGIDLDTLWTAPEEADTPVQPLCKPRDRLVAGDDSPRAPRNTW
jgi:2-hydroxy-3-oxopropionate reductase